MSTSATLTRHQIDTLQAELDAIGSELRADLGARDARHIRRVVRLAMWCAISGRSLLMFGRDPISFAAGVLLLTVSRILDVMEPAEHLKIGVVERLDAHGNAVHPGIAIAAKARRFHR